MFQSPIDGSAFSHEAIHKDKEAKLKCFNPL